MTEYPMGPRVCVEKAGMGMKSPREDISLVYSPFGKTSTYTRTYLAGIIRGRMYTGPTRNVVVEMTGWNSRVGVRSIKHVEMADGLRPAVARIENSSTVRF